MNVFKNSKRASLNQPSTPWLSHQMVYELQAGDAVDEENPALTWVV